MKDGRIVASIRELTSVHEPVRGPTHRRLPIPLMILFLLAGIAVAVTLGQVVGYVVP